MTTRLMALGLLCCLVLGGCATKSGLPTADDLLAGAHGSLVQDDLDTARQWLGSARGTLETKRQEKEYELLMAELDLRSGHPELALQSMDHLLQDHADDPRVHEMAGKAHLQLGAFNEASGHFVVAASRYRTDVDIQRANDLLTLSRGFEVYAEGRIEVARERWLGIRDRALRASILPSAGEDDPGAPSSSDAFASNSIPAP